VILTGALCLAVRVPLFGQTTETSRVLDGAGGVCTNAAYAATVAACQSGPVGFNSGIGKLNYSGFLQTFVARPDLDNDADGTADENDPDDDNDGLTDATELGGSAFEPSVYTDMMLSDTDGDGATDGQEAVAGTNPLEFESLFRITRVDAAPDTVTVFWQGRGGRTYELICASNLLELATNAVLVTTVTAEGGSHPWFETESSGTNQSPSSFVFYRVRTSTP